jgi:hypothetical protein
MLTCKTCVKIIHICMATSFEIDDHVMVGIYYQKWGCAKNYYLHLANSQMVYLGVDLVVAWCKYDWVDPSRTL